MSRPSILALPLVAAWLSLATACGGSLAADPSGSDGGTPNDAAPTPTTSPTGTGTAPKPNPPPSGLSLPSDGTLTLKLDGGFSANAQDTSACIVEHERYDYDAATSKLAWERCVIADGGARNELLNGAVQLSAAQTEALSSALAGVRVVGIVSVCGSDLPEETLEIGSRSGLAPELFYDQFTRCSDRSITHVTGLDVIETVFAAVAH